jgi:hypothetical protein
VPFFGIIDPVVVPKDVPIFQLYLLETGWGLLYTMVVMLPLVCQLAWWDMADRGGWHVEGTELVTRSCGARFSGRVLLRAFSTDRPIWLRSRHLARGRQEALLPNRELRDLYADSLFDLHRLLEEVRFEVAWAVMLLVDFRVRRDRGEVEPHEEHRTPAERP